MPNRSTYYARIREKTAAHAPECVIGDVHGHYRTLLALVERLPKNARLVFVGDLIDRGPQSREVVRFVREGGYPCVMGNHESLMIRDAPKALEAMRAKQPMPELSWLPNGGTQTLASYGLSPEVFQEMPRCHTTLEGIARLMDDLHWIQNLPPCVTLEGPEGAHRPVVVSHGCVANIWPLRLSDPEDFAHKAMWIREIPRTQPCEIFNVFGHTPVSGGVETGPCHANVDTGCYKDKPSYGRLSAYCVQTGEVFSVPRVDGDETAS